MTDTAEHTLSPIAMMILIVIAIMMFLFLINQLTAGAVTRWVVCGILFKIPLGPMFSAVTQGCAAIPTG